MSDPGRDQQIKAARLAGLRGDLATIDALAEALGDDPGLMLHRAQALIARREPAKAVTELDRFLATDAPATPGLRLKITALINLRRRDAAFATAERLLDGAEGEPLLRWLEMARVHNNFGAPTEALELLDQVLAKLPRNGDALNYRGRALMMLDRHEEAVAVYDRLLETNPRNQTLQYNRAMALMGSGQVAEARNLLHEVAEAPNRPPYARLNRGIADLLMGCFPHGLEDMTARWQLPDQYIKRRVTDDLPNWVGAPLKGLRLVVYGEQGLGDAIQCVRFVPRLVEAGAEVTLAVDEALHPLLAQLGVPMVAQVDAAEGFDARVSVMDLPMVARIGLTDLWPGAPYLAAAPERLAAWQARLGEGFKVAIAWSGKASMRVNARRSFPPGLVTALGRVPGVRLISVQKGAEVGALPIETLEELDADGAFLDTAAVMQACDLVITCDTSIAHLAGALGCPVWIGLRAVPDWRWMLERSDSPWYPSAVLFRQTAPGDWSSVERGMVAALTELTAS